MIHFKIIPGTVWTESRIAALLRQIADDFERELAPSELLALLSRPEVFGLMLAPNFREQQELVQLMTGGLAYASFAQATTSFERAFNGLRGLMSVIYRGTTVDQRGPEAQHLTGDLSANMRMSERDIVRRLDMMTSRLMQIYTRGSTSNRVSWRFGDVSAGQTRGVEFVPVDYNALSVLLRVCYEMRCLLLHGHANRSLATLGHRTTPFLLAGDFNAVIRTTPTRTDTTQAQATAGDSAQAVVLGTGDGATGSIDAGNARDEMDPLRQLLTMELQNLHDRAIREVVFPTNSIFANNFVGLYQFEIRAVITIITAILFDALCPNDRMDGTFMEAEVLLLLEVLGGVRERHFWPPPRQ